MEKLLLTTKTGVAVYDCKDYFKVVLPETEGINGYRWVNLLKEEGLLVSGKASEILRNSKTKPTLGVVNVIGILKGHLFKNGKWQTNHNIRRMAEVLKWGTPNSEIAGLIYRNFTHEDLKIMGLSWIITMHKTSGSSGLLSVGVLNGSFCLSVFLNDSNDIWPGSNFGFAFIISSTNSLESKAEDF